MDHISVYPVTSLPYFPIITVNWPNFLPGKTVENIKLLNKLKVRKKELHKWKKYRKIKTQNNSKTKRRQKTEIKKENKTGKKTERYAEWPIRTQKKNDWKVEIGISKFLWINSSLILKFNQICYIKGAK